MVKEAGGTPQFLANPDKSLYRIFSPEPVCRPDGVIMLKHPDFEKDSSRCAILVGCAAYSDAVSNTKVTSTISKKNRI